MQSESWSEEKGKHFIVQYLDAEDYVWVRKVLRHAEDYYDKLAHQIGYARYQNFWTWDERVKIIIYPDKERFTNETGQPAWAVAGAARDNSSGQLRAIVTFKQEAGFLDGILPHEISHLVLRDFVGFEKTIPLWFNEGVAQLQEKGKKDMAHVIMRNMVRKKEHIPLHTLNTLSIAQEEDSFKVAIFYAESVSVVNYLIKTYGSSKFGQLCSYLRDGNSISQALRKTYSSTVKSLEALEERWTKYMVY